MVPNLIGKDSHIIHHCNVFQELTSKSVHITHMHKGGCGEIHLVIKKVSGGELELSLDAEMRGL